MNLTLSNLWSWLKYLNHRWPISCSLIKYFLSGFLIGIVLFHLLAPIASKDSLSAWTTRFRKEGSAVEMHAEDIWRHGRSTLKTFDPNACIMSFHRKGVMRWSKVQCQAEDELGQLWQYSALYDNYFQPSRFLLLFYTDVGPLREMKCITCNSSSRETP